MILASRVSGKIEDWAIPGKANPPYTARYLNDLWVFDIQEYKWTQVEFRETDPRPSYAIALPVPTFLVVMPLWYHLTDLAVAFHSSLAQMVSSYTVRWILYTIIRQAQRSHAGGYCKEYIKGKRPVGVMLEDTWLLKFVHRFILEIFSPIDNPLG